MPPATGRPTAPSAPSGCTELSGGEAADSAADAALRPGGAGAGPLLVLCLAQFIMVVDTTIMNVSINKLVEDLHTRSSASSRPSPCTRW